MQKIKKITTTIGHKIKQVIEDIQGIFEPEPALVPVRVKDHRRRISSR